MGTLDPTYDVLFEEDNYYIVNNDGYAIGFERDSVIIHVCPVREGQEYYYMTLTMAHSHNSRCYYCHTDIPESVQTLYKLQNFDYFPGDRHARWKPGPWKSNPITFTNKNK